MDFDANIWTEGKTDQQHLKRAAQALHISTKLAFQEFDGDLGDDQLLKQCVALSRVPQPRPTIFIFDHDNDAVVNRVSVPEHPFKAWGNNVFSLAIPIPDHRKGESAICIESYYTDEQLRTTDIQGRRLYLSKEFNPVSGRHYGDPRLSVGNKSRLGRPDTVINRIIDAEVYDEKNANVALSKGSFAVNVLEAHDSFVNITFSAFQIIFDIISTIVADAAIKGSEQESVREAVFCWGRLNSEFANRQ